MVLDTSHSTNGKRRKDNLRVRSFPAASSEINPQELSLQKDLQNRLKTLQKRSPIPGMILSASSKIKSPPKSLARVGVRDCLPML